MENTDQSIGNIYRVLITGNVLSGVRKVDALSDLAILFNTDLNKIQTLFDNAPTVLNKLYSKERAQKIYELIHEKGMEAKIITDEEWKRIQHQQNTVLKSADGNNIDITNSARQQNGSVEGRSGF